MAKRATKRQSKKEYTLTEFKAWLEGIEEMQEANWAPSTAQWQKIRDKIMSIVEEEVVVEVPAAPQRPVAPPPVQMPQMAPQVPVTPPPLQTALPVPEMSPAASAALKGNLPTEMITSADGGKSKTPDIDTADGNYGSSFA